MKLSSIVKFTLWVKFRLMAKWWANLTSLVRSTNFTKTGFPEAKHELWGFAVQLHFRGSENFTNRKKSRHTRFFVLRVCSFCRYKGLGSAHSAFVRSNAMLALLWKCKFSAKDIAHCFRTVPRLYFYMYLRAIKVENPRFSWFLLCFYLVLLSKYRTLIFLRWHSLVASEAYGKILRCIEL